MEPTERKCDWDFDSGRLPLDFVNTSHWHAGPDPIECLNTYADLIRGSLEGEVLTAQDARLLMEEAERRPTGYSLLPPPELSPHRRTSSS